MERLVSAFGLLVMLGLAWAMSAHRWRVSWRIVAIGCLLQIGFACLALKTSVGVSVLKACGDGAESLLGFVDHGSAFVFGPKFKDFKFAFKVLPTIIFFSAFMSVLYYLGVMQWIVRGLAWAMQKTMGTSGAESLSTAANIFVGQTEAPLVIKPYVQTLTLSELMTVMVGGFATIAGGVLAAYVGMNIDARHLLTASLIAAPATLVVAKIMQPEVDQPETLGKIAHELPTTATNIIDAAAEGATDGLKLALNVAAMLIAFLGLIALLDFLFGWVGSWFGWQWTLSRFLGYLFWPVAWCIGIESKDCLHAGELLGLRMVANEFVAYQKFADWNANPTDGIELAERTRVLLTYALCGFANFGSIGIQIGGISALAPERRGDLAKLGLRAMLGGTLACLMTACVAGVLL